jgi:6,7-dimethyl-8-ribityllumazine synthase
MKIYEGKICEHKKKICIIVSRFNGLVTERLLEGAMDCFRRHKIKEEYIEVVKVPGSFEIPQTLKLVLYKYDAFLCLGALIRGETTHYEFLANSVTKEIGRLAVESSKPISYGIITAETLDQALERAGGKQGNKGFDSALALLEQIGVKEEINGKKKD